MWMSLSSTKVHSDQYMILPELKISHMRTHTHARDCVDICDPVSGVSLLQVRHRCYQPCTASIKAHTQQNTAYTNTSLPFLLSSQTFCKIVVVWEQDTWPLTASTFNFKSHYCNVLDASQLVCTYCKCVFLCYVAVTNVALENDSYLQISALLNQMCF